MNEADTFWKLNDPSKIESQDEFYDFLSKSDHLKNTIYAPDKLERLPRHKTTRITNKKFEHVSFSKTSIAGIIFRDCVFERCQFIGSTIHSCEFHNCKFILTNTYKITISMTYVDPLSFKRCLNPRNHQNVGVHLYQMLLKNSRDMEQVEYERDAHFLFLRWKRFQEGYEIAESRKQMASWYDFKSLKIRNHLTSTVWNHK